jgi:hypothetical protein
MRRSVNTEHTHFLIYNINGVQSFLLNMNHWGYGIVFKGKLGMRQLNSCKEDVARFGLSVVVIVQSTRICEHTKFKPTQKSP